VRSQAGRSTQTGAVGQSVRIRGSSPTVGEGFSRMDITHCIGDSSNECSTVVLLPAIATLMPVP
jgi:hypothetical protein